jgi:hypothetical protein
MFATFLNKEDRHIQDLSAFINYTPEQLMFYYYNSHINITLDTYLQMQEWFDNGYGNRDNLNMWLDFIDETLKADSDLETLQNSEYLNTIGPYYYMPTCTQFFFCKLYSVEHEPLTSTDFDVLFNYHKIPPVDKELQKYSHQRKLPKKPVKTKDELIRDINMCAKSLRHIQTINQYTRYLNMFLEERRAFVDAEDMLPSEPARMPEKPNKPSVSPVKFNLLHTMGMARLRKQSPKIPDSDYSRNVKIYYIRYREYEKACERFKEALQDWNESQESFKEKCREDIKKASANLKEALALLVIYYDIIRKSYIHSDYQKIDTLNTFVRYLETGRADTLQDCMNIYEEERLWTDIKASQQRIENTIHFLHSDNDALIQASKETSRLIASTIE